MLFWQILKTENQPTKEYLLFIEKRQLWFQKCLVEVSAEKHLQLSLLAIRYNTLCVTKILLSTNKKEKWCTANKNTFKSVCTTIYYRNVPIWRVKQLNNLYYMTNNQLVSSDSVYLNEKKCTIFMHYSNRTKDKTKLTQKGSRI